MTAPTPAPEAPLESRRSLWDRSWRIGLGLVCLVMVLMWAGIFLGFFDKTAPGTMSDHAFSEAAQPICAATKSRLDALPKAYETTNHVDRADVVARTNTDLRAMIDQLRAIAPTADRDGHMAQEWLDDWVTYIGNREDYVNRLRADESARFYETPKDGPTQQISKPIDRFAYVNNMDSCDTPGDMA
jgi:hypothetical protein